jgi:hypothetical protein
METKSIAEVEQSVQGALEALPLILRSSPISPLTQQITEAIKILAPAGYHPVVELQKNGRKKRRTASAEKNWSPETGEILISFSKDESAYQQGFGADVRQPQKPATPTRENEISAQSKSDGPSLPAEIQELCRTLEDVERQGRAFVALKWFRDDVLPATGYAWALHAEQRQKVLASAIEKGLVVTSRVPNPRSPFPTTAIRLNRSPVPAQSPGQRYAPVRIQGEPLSRTILRDRGTN